MNIATGRDACLGIATVGCTELVLIYDTFASYAWLHIGSWIRGLGAFLIAMTFRPAPRTRPASAPVPAEGIAARGETAVSHNGNRDAMRRRNGVPEIVRPKVDAQFSGISGSGIGQRPSANAVALDGVAERTDRL